MRYKRARAGSGECRAASVARAKEVSLMKQAQYQRALFLSLVGWTVLAGLCFAADTAVAGMDKLPSGITIARLGGILFGILAIANLFALGNYWLLTYRKRPAVEGVMVGRIYRMVAVFAIIGAVAYGFGKLANFGTLFGMFGGMLLGWSLQAPVSGFAAWVLVSLKRPIRPGDRVQFPSLGLTGDVKEIGPMYTMLDQVGGTVGSEEAVGRFILVPNAMLFSQVVINYTVTQEAAYMLDEQIIRITFDSDWEVAERILLDAATEVTRDIIKATNVAPYIRSDLYDYGVYLRLRYQTDVKERTQIAYEITKRIFKGIQQTRKVDLAIPYVYSYRAGVERKEFENAGKDRDAKQVQEIEIERINPGPRVVDPYDVEQVERSIATQGLLQPIVVVKTPDGKSYDLLAGDIRLEACKRLGWQQISAVVLDKRPEETN
jgi:small-conductance mechanosensitive channel/uncharacterized ParB-like nuclease family protein